MYYTIEIPLWVIIITLVILSLIAGFLMAWLALQPSKPKKPIDYDGTNGKGYQPIPPKHFYCKCSLLPDNQPRPAPPQAEGARNRPPKEPLEPDYNTPSATKT